METLNQIEQKDVDSLVINDLTIADLDKIAWSGNPAHPRYVREALFRAEKGEVDYLAVRNYVGEPISIGCVDYKVNNDVGTLCQLVTMESLRGLGIGKRGLKTAMMAVEDINTKARELYERLGYKECGHKKDSWEVEDKQGNKHIYNAETILLKKEL